MDYVYNYGSYKKATDDVLGWIRALSGAERHISLSAHIKLAEQAVTNGIFLPDNIVNNLQKALDGRLKAADFHVARGIFCEKHTHIIKVLTTLYQLFCGKPTASSPKLSPPIAPFGTLNDCHYLPSICSNEQFHHHEQYPPYYPMPIEYSPYQPREFPQPSYHPPPYGCTLQTLQEFPGFHPGDQDTSSTIIRPGLDPSMRVQMSVQHQSNTTVSTRRLTSIPISLEAGFEPTLEEHPSPACSTASMSSYDEDFPPLSSPARP